MTGEPHDLAVEAALRAAFERELPPLGFAQRVQGAADLARRGRGARTHAYAWVQFGLAAALMLAIILPLGLRLRQGAEAARGQVAKAQVLLALRITGKQLRSIEARTQTMHTGALPEGDSQ